MNHRQSYIDQSFLLKSIIFSLLMLFAFISIANAKNPQVIMKTNQGDITIELFQDKAPISVKNFFAYIDSKFYDGTIFHRVINNFMIQGGGFDENMTQKQTLAPIKNEAANGLSNTTGTLAMARTGVIDSATSQFFINVNDNKFLDHKSNDARGYGYAVFGKVIKGMPVVNKMKMAKTTNKGPYANVPVSPIIIKSILKL